MTRPGEEPVPESIPESLRVDDRLRIPVRELTWRFDPSGGPGGQHANRASSRAELRWNVEGSASLSEGQRARLLDKLGPEVRISVDEARSQSRNRSIALDRLAERIRDAMKPERTRRPTKPSKGAKRRRLEDKRKRSQTKQGRGRVRPDE